MTGTPTDDEIPDTGGEEWVSISDLKVTQSRITIPSRPRETHDIGELDDIVDVVVRPYDTDSDALHVKQARVGGQHRILLPSHRVEMANLADAAVKIDVRKRGNLDELLGDT